MTLKEADKFLNEIIEKLSNGKYPYHIWVGKDYSIGNLIDDLVELKKEYKR